MTQRRWPKAKTREKLHAKGAVVSDEKRATDGRKFEMVDLSWCGVKQEHFTACARLEHTKRQA